MELDDARPPADTVSLDHFLGLYEAKDDPWDVASKWHNQRKYAVTLASLPRAHYRRAYEPGASIGLFTSMLAARCDEVLAVDSVPSAVDQARAFLKDLSHVRVEVANLPAQLPSGEFDLIVVADLLYYFSAGDLAAALDGFVRMLDSDGDLVSLHFRNSGGYDGAQVHSVIAARPELSRIVHHEDEWFVLDVFRRTSPM
ncbi:nodulation S family protein [Actinoplanes bogorensis]|uniref:Nodulation S family protein n=1 Tax=Paractinoplanes bogorensis TaxID=1610840 RepID=A0ABS5Z035_9ACTN|nr:SAM-dependent methyltransferase [Actinoplanes bogorensis]MBU2669056.1 nodulation S family protein [Actinoplanes bogorensis]